MTPLRLLLFVSAANELSSFAPPTFLRINLHADMETGLLIAYIALGVMAVCPIYFGSFLSLHYPDSKEKVALPLSVIKCPDDRVRNPNKNHCLLPMSTGSL